MPSRNPNALVKVDRERPRHFERPDIRPLRSPNIHRVPIPAPRIPEALGGVRRRGGRRRQRGVRRLRFRRGWDMRTFSGRFVRIEDDSPCRLVRGSAERYTAPYADSFSIHMRASPSGKASASQADTRGFESRCPLQEFQGTGDGAFSVSGLISGTRTRWGREAAGTLERSPASTRGGISPYAWMCIRGFPPVPSGNRDLPAWVGLQTPGRRMSVPTPLTPRAARAARAAGRPAGGAMSPQMPVHVRLTRVPAHPCR